MSLVRATDIQLVRRAAHPGDPEAGLAAVAELRRRLELLEGLHVEQAVRRGWSWQRVATALGVTKQAAHSRHARRAQGAPDRVVVTGRARVAVERARKEANRLGAGRTGTEHLLLALLGESTGPVAEALRACGITEEAVRARLEWQPEPGPVRGRLPPVSPETREALQQSLREAVARGDGHLDVEHLLLALLHEPGGRACAEMTAGGRSPRAIERRLKRALTGHAGDAPPRGAQRMPISELSPTMNR